ncbi:HNH endonuclease [Mesorhizobium sp. BR1-1-3]|uniref:HNH endonuclease n=1 Tax=Mesorhizobium sp. BR1-1-3 TaxID=2876651 RepID=UPI001CD0AA55|nr:HNH endonuclease [Mesorhizobium sp. BR1-1-3]MBZ9888112.1 HNH endonuclease [Mesorhizobium sp. BR1-1-3]
MTTQQRLKELFLYDPLTGVFTRRVRTANSVYVGDVAGTTTGDGYTQIKVDGVDYLAHRLAVLYMTGDWPDEDVDHEDLDKSNNVWLNLRPANQSLNNANKPLQSNNKTGFKGVSLHNGGPKYRADVKIEGKKKYLGCFDTADEAHVVYMLAANDLYGSYARSA